MNLKLYLSNLPAIMVGVILLVIIGLSYFLKLSKKGRKSPLTRELLRSPENKKWDMYIYFGRREGKKAAEINRR